MSPPRGRRCGRRRRLCGRRRRRCRGRRRRGLPLRLCRERNNRGSRCQQQDRGQGGQAGYFQHGISRIVVFSRKVGIWAGGDPPACHRCAATCRPRSLIYALFPDMCANAKTRWPRRGAGPSFRQKVAGFYTKALKSPLKNRPLRPSPQPFASERKRRLNAPAGPGSKSRIPKLPSFASRMRPMRPFRLRAARPLSIMAHAPDPCPAVRRAPRALAPAIPCIRRLRLEGVMPSA